MRPRTQITMPASEMIEGSEAWTRFLDAAKKLVSTPKSAAPNPFG